MDNWISVKDRLPDTSCLVLAADKEYGIVLATFRKMDTEKGSGYGRVNNWHIQPFKGHWDMCDCSITHWLPIPGLPKSEPRRAFSYRHRPHIDCAWMVYHHPSASFIGNWVCDLPDEKLAQSLCDRLNELWEAETKRNVKDE